MDILKEVTELKSDYCCSGTLTRQPLNLFYYNENTGKTNKLNFHDDNFDDLNTACTPATFGRNKESVLDPSYRFAYNLKADNFSLNVNPHTDGILAKIARMLFPTVEVEIKAELYKLNMYTKNGLFKAHQDTPRDNNQIGTLVLCLPTKFEGGQLRVKDEIFDWGPNCKDDHIQWVSFFSDCEHEVLPVTSGTRITIAYNLIRCFNTEVMSISNNFSSNYSRIFDKLNKQFVDNSLTKDKILKGEIAIGFGCDQMYQSNLLAEKNNIDPLTYLKGKDLQMFSLLKELGLKPITTAIVSFNGQCYGKILPNPITYEQYKKYSNNYNYKYYGCILQEPKVIINTLDDINPDEYKEQYIELEEGEIYSRILNPPADPDTSGECLYGDVTVEDYIESMGGIILNHLEWAIPCKGGSSLLGVAATYGNEPSTHSFYINSTILIGHDQHPHTNKEIIKTSEKIKNINNIEI